MNEFYMGSIRLAILKTTLFRTVQPGNSIELWHYLNDRAGALLHETKITIRNELY